MASTRPRGNGGKKNGKSRRPEPARHSIPTRRTTAMEAKPTRSEITRQAIAEAAYYLWLRQGGDEVSNWLEAERQLKAKLTLGVR